MSYLAVSEEDKNLNRLIDEVVQAHEPTILVKNKKNAAVLLSFEDWSGIKETLYILSRPKLHRAINKARAEKLEDCKDTLDW